MYLPPDPADLFARLILEFDADLDRYEVFRWMQDERVGDIADLLERTALEEDEISSDSIAELLEFADDYAERIFSILLGLDRALLYANPFFGTYDQGKLTRVATRYALTGALNADTTSGVLLPRTSFPGRLQSTPNTLNDAFAGVVWVPRDEWNRTNHVRLRPRNDLSRLERQLEVVVACVPVVDDPDDFNFTTVDRDGGHFFRVRNRDERDTLDFARTLDDLDLSGAAIALFPELVLTRALLSKWVDLISRRPPPTESRLKWLVLGSGDVDGDGDRPSNRCVMVDRLTAEIVLTQDKVYPFTLTTSQLSEWKLEQFLGSLPIEEDMVSGRRVTVAESRLGRLAVLVCEDLARTMDLGPTLRSHGISHILSPVLSNEVKPHHWEHAKAKDYATETGAVVIVSNSLVIPRLMDETGAIGTSIVHSPLATQLRTSHDRADLGIFKIAAGDPIPLTADRGFSRTDELAADDF